MERGERKKMLNNNKPHTYCDECKGSCWVPGNNAKTQENAFKRFGIIPNNCVNGAKEIYCPYAKKQK